MNKIIASSLKNVNLNGGVIGMKNEELENIKKLAGITPIMNEIHEHLWSPDEMNFPVEGRFKEDDPEYSVDRTVDGSFAGNDSLSKGSGALVPAETEEETYEFPFEEMWGEDFDDINEGIVMEKSAPGQEKWIKKNKKRFIDQYGKKKGLRILYSTAWKRSKKKVKENKEMDTIKECGEFADLDSINVNSSYDSQSGEKSITITARNNSADELSNILKLSGLLPGTEKNVTDQNITSDEINPSASNVTAIVDQPTVNPEVVHEHINEARGYYVQFYSPKSHETFYLKTLGGITRDKSENNVFADLEEAKEKAAKLKEQGSVEDVKVLPVLEESLSPERKESGMNDANKTWQNEPNEQMASWKAVVDDADGLSKVQDMFNPVKGSDNIMKVAANKKEEKLHENVEINTLAEQLRNKFQSLKEDIPLKNSEIIFTTHSGDTYIAPNAESLKKYREAIKKKDWDTVLKCEESWDSFDPYDPKGKTVRRGKFNERNITNEAFCKCGRKIPDSKWQDKCKECQELEDEKKKEIKENDAKFAVRNLESVNLNKAMFSKGFERNFEMEEDSNNNARFYTPINSLDGEEFFAIAPNWDWEYEQNGIVKETGNDRNSFYQYLADFNTFEDYEDEGINLPISESTASKIATKKKEHPEEFCKEKNCLYRTKDKYCPKHKKKVNEDAHDLISHLPKQFSLAEICKLLDCDAVEAIKYCEQKVAEGEFKKLDAEHYELNSLAESVECSDEKCEKINKSLTKMKKLINVMKKGGKVIANKTPEKKEAPKEQETGKKINGLGKGIYESVQDSPVFRSIMRRINNAHSELFDEYGFDKVNDAVEYIAEGLNDIHEIGSSDVSAWVEEVIDYLETGKI